MRQDQRRQLVPDLSAFRVGGRQSVRRLKFAEVWGFRGLGVGGSGLQTRLPGKRTIRATIRDSIRFLV